MKTALLNIALLIFACSALAAQTGLSGTWVCPLDKNEGFDKETTIFTEDGYYYSILSYLNGAEYGIGPDIFMGVYEFDGATLNLYDIKNDSRSSFPVNVLNSRTLQLADPHTGEQFNYHYQGKGVLDQNQRAALLSWENYRKLGGAWASSQSILKVMPSLGLIIIRVPGDPDFLTWGHYIVDGNKLTLKEISAEETVFYTGTITEFNRGDFTIVNNGDAEHFQFQGALNLDESETTMVQQYMNVNHRISMSAIDMIDGVQDFIWKRVDEYGNER